MEKYTTEYNDKGIIKSVINFNTLLNEDDAYFIGYMSGDGGFIANDGYPFMSVSSTEDYIMEAFQEYTSHAIVRNIGKKSSEKVKAINNVYELRFPAKMSETFKNFGIFCKKPQRRLVGVPNKLFGAYLRGLIDSDGFVTVTHRKDCRTPRIRFFITHGSEKLLADVQEKLNDIYGVNSTLRQHGDNVWRLQGQNTVQNIELFKTIFHTRYKTFNVQKHFIVEEYLDTYVPQASDELLEPVWESAAKR